MTLPFFAFSLSTCRCRTLALIVSRWNLAARNQMQAIGINSKNRLLPSQYYVRLLGKEIDRKCVSSTCIFVSSDYRVKVYSAHKTFSRRFYSWIFMQSVWEGYCNFTGNRKTLSHGCECCYHYNV